jgi:hypothetical protein
VGLRKDRREQKIGDRLRVAARLGSQRWQGLSAPPTLIKCSGEGLVPYVSKKKRLGADMLGLPWQRAG